MQARYTFYWLLTGSLLGLGLLSLLSLGAPLVLLSLFMLIYGIIRWRFHNLWALFIGFGAVPAFILFIAILIAYPACNGKDLVSPSDSVHFSCSSIPPSYYLMAIAFSLIAVVGIFWPLVRKVLTH
ncbi:hypothetical protein [Dictyobacter kobayashii]|uniref:hypothetical protein n=1 Tax=Dictyobacter kobayashii TaxID=2014872 RepID=UPI000F83CC2A|nr:hypothetical protein [Dictyobacter kobayashii]